MHHVEVERSLIFLHELFVLNTCTLTRTEGGSSSNPCSDVFAGSEAFSEVENRNVRDEILRLGSSVKVYLTFHSYAQMWLYTWGYTSSLPADWQDLVSHSFTIFLTATII